MKPTLPIVLGCALFWAASASAIDLNHDGISDVYAEFYGIDGVSPDQVPASDADGDGFSLLQESEAGTSPWDNSMFSTPPPTSAPGSFLVRHSYDEESGNLILHWWGVAGIKYGIKYTDITWDPWNFIEAEFTGSGAAVSYDTGINPFDQSGGESLLMMGEGGGGESFFSMESQSLSEEEEKPSLIEHPMEVLVIQDFGNGWSEVSRLSSSGWDWALSDGDFSFLPGVWEFSTSTDHYMYVVLRHSADWSNYLSIYNRSFTLDDLPSGEDIYVLGTDLEVSGQGITEEDSSWLDDIHNQLAIETEKQSQLTFEESSLLSLEEEGGSGSYSLLLEEEGPPLDRFWSVITLGSDDQDGDLLNAYEEGLLGLNDALKDFDGDGAPDGWEWANGLNPKSNDMTGDLDGDTSPNQEDARPNDDQIGQMVMTITFPANGSTM